MWGVVVELRLNRINARFVRFTITQDLAVTNTVISRHLQTLHVGASRAIKQADTTVVCVCGKYLKTNMWTDLNDASHRFDTEVVLYRFRE